MSDRRPLSTHHRVSSADVNATIVKAGPAELYGVVATNVNAAQRYLKLYNKATAPSESDTPLLTIPLKADGGASGFVIDQPIAFVAGLSFRLTTGLAINDTGAAAAGEQLVNLLYL